MRPRLLRRACELHTGGEGRRIQQLRRLVRERPGRGDQEARPADTDLLRLQGRGAALRGVHVRQLATFRRGEHFARCRKPKPTLEELLRVKDRRIVLQEEHINGNSPRCAEVRIHPCCPNQ